jgi:hypothetical protein
MKLSLHLPTCKGKEGGESVRRATLVLSLRTSCSLRRCKEAKLWKELSKKKKQDEVFSIDKCVDEVDTMDGLSDVEKAYAMTIFKYEIDREVFMKMKNKNVRLI